MSHFDAYDIPLKAAFACAADHPTQRQTMPPDPPGRTLGVPADPDRVIAAGPFSR